MKLDTIEGNNAFVAEDKSDRYNNTYTAGLILSLIGYAAVAIYSMFALWIVLRN